ncbi:MAG: formate/nitrite transporter family protein [Thermodesulfobacteriota bacterium]
MPASVDELVVRVADVCSYKWDMLRERPHAFLLSAFAGGAFVSFGAMLALSVSAGVPENLAPGIANLAMGLVFCFSLVIIMFSGMTLVTADMAYGVIGVFHRRLGWGQFLWMVAAGYIGNFAGSMFFLWLLSMGAGYEAWPWLARAHAIGAFKTGATATQIFVMGIICTWTLQSAAILFIKAGDDVSRILMAAYGPLAFVAGMTEHCIANIGFLAVPLFQQDLYLAKAAELGAQAGPLLHWGFGQFGWAHNQLYTVLGNFIGGILFVGIVFQLVSNPRRVMRLYAAKTERMLKL